MYLEGYVDVSILANTNDWDPNVVTADWIRVTSSGTWDVTGLTFKYRGRLLTVSVLSGTIVIRNASGSSTLGNRFVAAGDITVTAGQTVTLAYDLSSTAWRVLTQPFVLSNDLVTFAVMQNIATDTLIGRDAAGTGDPESITVGGGIEFTGAGAIRTTAFTGDVTKTAGGTALTIASNAVTNAKAADMAANTIKGNNTGSTADPKDLTVAEVKAMLGTPVVAMTTAAMAKTFSTAFSDVTGLTAALTAGGTYLVRAMLLTTFSTGGAKAQLTYTGTAGTCNLRYFGRTGTSLVTTTHTALNWSETISTSATGSPSWTTWEGMVVATTAGNLKVQFAQLTSSAAASNANPGSYLEVIRIS